MTDINIPIPEDRKLANFRQIAVKFLTENPIGGHEADEKKYQNLVLAYADHLDSFATLDEKMQIVALQKSLQVYAFFYERIKELVPVEKMAEILKEVKARFDHQK